jgi:hypothetical protein
MSTRRRSWHGSRKVKPDRCRAGSVLKTVQGVILLKLAAGKQPVDLLGGYEGN